MNERINELAKQADAHAHNRMAEIGGSYLEYYNEKFAELIVRECAKACEKNRWMALNGFQRSKQIKEHFGVEE